MQKGNRPILLLVDWEAGHHGSNEEMLYMYKFAFWQTGHPDFQMKKLKENWKFDIGAEDGFTMDLPETYWLYNMGKRDILSIFMNDNRKEIVS